MAVRPFGLPSLSPKDFMRVPDFADRKAAADAGCVAYLTKPFLGKTLIDAIENATASHRMP